MTIKGKVYCLFEQSGSFKNEFRKLGYEAFDIDIANDYGQTDCVGDLFRAVQFAYDGKPSLFDCFTADDLLLAFFPCIHFCDVKCLMFRCESNNYKGWSVAKMMEHNIYLEQ